MDREEFSQMPGERLGSHLVGSAFWVWTPLISEGTRLHDCKQQQPSGGEVWIHALQLRLAIT